MTMPTHCPEPGRLQDLLAEALPPDEDAAVSVHVETCERCQHALDALTADTAGWPALAADGPPHEPALRHAIRELESQSCTTEFRDEAAAPPAPALPFLAPADRPDCLGRLGPYEVLAEVGRGSMGVVLKAFDPALRRTVALKVMAPTRAAGDLARRQFIREARAAAAVTHENVVTIHAVEEADGLPYLVMRYVAGTSLQQRLDAGAPPDLEAVLRVARQVAAGLAAAHARGLIHRDVKPANILLEPVGDGPGGAEGERVVLTDFGLARPVDDASLSQSGVVAGTPLYMSPEQIGGGPVDHRSDLYSLGVLLYRLAAGREPFTGPNTAAVWSQHLFERPTSPAEAAPGRVPSWLEALVLALLQKDPVRRPQSAEEVMAWLDQGTPAPLPAPQEEARLTALRRYRILDTDPEEGFDELAALAAHVCNTPIALITLIDADRQWFKSRVGLSLKETSRNVSFCTNTVGAADVFVVRDAREDERFAANPLVCGSPQVRFYAGVPLITADGHALGALCVMDREPRQLTPDQMTALASLCRLALTHLELRRNLLELQGALAERPPA
jgi:serine/threonine protein kinase